MGVSPVGVDAKMFLDAIVMILAMIVLLLSAYSNKKVSKDEGLLLTLTHGIYTIYIIIRN